MVLTDLRNLFSKLSHMSLFKGLLYDTVAGIPQRVRHKMQNVSLFIPTLEMMTYHLCYIQFIRNKSVSPVEWENKNLNSRRQRSLGLILEVACYKKNLDLIIKIKD